MGLLKYAENILNKTQLDEETQKEQLVEQYLPPDVDLEKKDFLFSEKLFGKWKREAGFDMGSLFLRSFLADGRYLCYCSSRRERPFADILSKDEDISSLYSSPVRTKKGSYGLYFSLPFSKTNLFPLFRGETLIGFYTIYTDSPFTDEHLTKLRRYTTKVAEALYMKRDLYFQGLSARGLYFDTKERKEALMFVRDNPRGYLALKVNLKEIVNTIIARSTYTLTSAIEEDLIVTFASLGGPLSSTFKANKNEVVVLIPKQSKERPEIEGHYYLEQFKKSICFLFPTITFDKIPESIEYLDKPPDEAIFQALQE